MDFGSVSSPVAHRISDDLSKAGGLEQGRVDAPIAEMVLDRLADEKGISLLLYSYPVRLVHEGDTAFGAVIGSKSGEQIVKAKVIVDATEEAVFWRQTDVESRMAAPRARQSVFFNHLEGELEMPLDLGDGVRILPSIWDAEVCVEFEIDGCDALTRGASTAS